MELEELPTTQFGRLTTPDGLVIQQQSGAWLVWNDRLWPSGMRVFSGPRLSATSDGRWLVREGLGNDRFGEPGLFYDLDTAIAFAEKIVKAAYYDYERANPVPSGSPRLRIGQTLPVTVQVDKKTALLRLVEI